MVAVVAVVVVLCPTAVQGFWRRICCQCRDSPTRQLGWTGRRVKIVDQRMAREMANPSIYGGGDGKRADVRHEVRRITGVKWRRQQLSIRNGRGASVVATGESRREER
ncbi:hypothetical protein IWZ01DRAFT_120643 [Phyllosticta capitalensis]